jgi:hypothetical protein
LPACRAETVALQTLGFFDAVPRLFGIFVHILSLF